MDFLQVALIFLIILLSIFLAITGFQVFLILRDLKKALNRLNKVLEAGEGIVTEVEKPVASAASLMTTLAQGAQALIHPNKNKSSAPKPKRFYKRTL